MRQRELRIVKTPVEAGTGIYLHVPYCASLCSYCDFFREASPEGVPGGFVDLLLTEADLYRETPPIRADSLYLGGGTPSLMADPDLQRLMEGLSERFDGIPQAEVTLEANPETFDFHRARRWREMGVNRLSIGIQSFRSAQLKLLGRRADADRSVKAPETAAAAGFRDLSIDLMMGIPDQSEEEIGDAVQLIASLPVTHVSCYLLDLHEGTPLHVTATNGGVRLPGEEPVVRFYEILHEGLTGEGFLHYEISNYAKPGYACRHNLKYWAGGDYIGLGPSAHGRFRGWLTQNPRSIPRWTESLERGEFPFEERRPISQRMRAENTLIFGLRLSEGVAAENLEGIQEELEIDLAEKVKPLVDAGYALLDDEGLRLTQTGFLVSNEVIGYLLPDSFRARDRYP